MVAKKVVSKDQKQARQGRTHVLLPPRAPSCPCRPHLETPPTHFELPLQFIHHTARQSPDLDPHLPRCRTTKSSLGTISLALSKFPRSSSTRTTMLRRQRWCGRRARHACSLPDTTRRLHCRFLKVRSYSIGILYKGTPLPLTLASSPTCRW